MAAARSLPSPVVTPAGGKWRGYSQKRSGHAMVRRKAATAGPRGSSGRPRRMRVLKPFPEAGRGAGSREVMWLVQRRQQACESGSWPNRNGTGPAEALALSCRSARRRNLFVARMRMRRAGARADRRRKRIFIFVANKSCNKSLYGLIAHRPISHVPVAVCQSVGIRTRGRTAARSEIAKTQDRKTWIPNGRSSEHLTGSRRRNRRTPLSTGDAA
jgi:hypothetical protein